MRFRVEFSQEGAGPFEPLVELAAASWQLAEFDLFETTDGLLPCGYYRVWEDGESCALYRWDGQLGSFSELDAPAGAVAQRSGMVPGGGISK